MRYALALLALALCAAETAPELVEANRALYRNQPAEARSLASKYLKEHPASNAARLLLAKAHMAQAEFQAAYAVLAEAIRREPSNTEALYYQAKLCGILSQLEYRDLFTLAPDSWRVHQALGESYMMQGDVRMADEEFLKALEGNPRSVLVLVMLGDLKRRASFYEESIGYYRRALELDAGDYDANYGMGACYLYQEDPKTAVEWFRKALRADADAADAHLALGIALTRSGDIAAAVGELKIAAQEPELARQAYPLLGRAYQKLNQPREAEQAFRKSRETFQAAQDDKP